MSGLVETCGLMVPDEAAIASAVRFFWRTRAAATQKQKNKGVTDRGTRSAVTAGKNMDAFARIIAQVIRANGGDGIEVCHDTRLLTLPGFSRPTKHWDILAVRNGKLIAAIELKSQVGPSFGNNFNNRAEEAIGTAHDFWTAYRDGALSDIPPPFLAWIAVVEDCDASRVPVRCDEPHYPVFPEFREASYLERYEILCRKLVREKLYSAAALLASSASTTTNGRYESLSEMTNISAVLRQLAAHCRGV